MSFSVISQKFLIFGGCPKIPFFWQLGPENAHPQNTIKIGVSAHQCLKNSYASRNGHFLDQKNPNPEIPVITKNYGNPYCYSVLANLKKENFQNLNLKHWKLKTQFLHPFFFEKGYF